MDTATLVAEIDAEIDLLQNVRVLLTGKTAPSKRGRRPKTPGFGKNNAPRKRKMSSEGRARIAAAQKARWAKAKK
jgi:hypothetical protein